MFAKYWDKVDDPRDISGVSRFLSGGLGGISSQLCEWNMRLCLLTCINLAVAIYPIETLKV